MGMQRAMGCLRKRSILFPNVEGLPDSVSGGAEHQALLTLGVVTQMRRSCAGLPGIWNLSFWVYTER